MSRDYEITETQRSEWAKIVGNQSKKTTCLHTIKKCGLHDKCKTIQRLKFMLNLFDIWVCMFMHLLYSNLAI